MNDQDVSDARLMFFDEVFGEDWRDKDLADGAWAAMDRVEATIRTDERRRVLALLRATMNGLLDDW